MQVESLKCSLHALCCGCLFFLNKLACASDRWCLLPKQRQTSWLCDSLFLCFFALAANVYFCSSSSPPPCSVLITYHIFCQVTIITTAPTVLVFIYKSKCGIAYVAPFQLYIKVIVCLPLYIILHPEVH